MLAPAALPQLDDLVHSPSLAPIADTASTSAAGACADGSMAVAGARAGSALDRAPDPTSDSTSDSASDSAAQPSEPAPAAADGADGNMPVPGRPLPVGLLADIAAGIAAAPEAWRHLVRHNPDGRDPVRLVATEAYEVWVIGWTPGQGVRPHDHGGSTAAVVVTEGELLEVDPTHRRRLVPGEVLRLGPDAVHDVVNHSNGPATSVHVYSPPLTRMTYYDPETWEPRETVELELEPPVLDGRRSGRLVHPSQAR
ncbi:MAG TPA: cysteine dioxygenase family protein [Acidimicrobiales bacterium]